MKDLRKLICLLALACTGLAGPAGAAVANKALVRPASVPLTKERYEAAKKKIEAQHRADRKACARLQGKRRDVCDAQAEGKEKAALAKLEARWRRTPDAIEEAKVVTAEANYKVAREKCEALKGQAEDRCLGEAKAAREAAIRQARVEKASEVKGVRAGS